MSRQYGLGLVRPPDQNHLHLYGYVPQAPPPMGSLKVRLNHPDRLFDTLNQGTKNACVAYGFMRLLEMMRLTSAPTPDFDPDPLWLASKQHDGMPSPRSNRGTTLRACADVLRNRGPWMIRHGKTDRNPTLKFGLSRNEWGVSVDAIRTALAEGQPVAWGSDWFPAYDNPPRYGGNSILHTGNAATDQEDGGHCICLVGGDDRLDTGVGLGGFFAANNWGRNWGDGGYAVLPYSEATLLMRRWAEVALVTLR